MSKFYITNGITQDGFGARLQRCFQVMSLAYKLQAQGVSIEYVHTPFAYNEDTPVNEDRTTGVPLRQNFSLANPYPYDDISHEGYMNRSRLWDKSLDYSGKTVYDLDIASLQVKEGYASLTEDIQNSNTAGKLYVVRYLHQEYDSGELDINTVALYRDRILSKFNITPSTTSDKQQVAIHIRRKDSIDKGGRHIHDSYYVELLDSHKQQSQSYDVTVYSQEVGFNAELYKDWKVVLDVDEDDFVTFKKFVHADYLVVGGSCLSYAAALLNKNKVVYHFQGHAAIGGWISVDDYIKLINK